MKNRRLMLIEYRDQKDVNRLDTCLCMCCMPHVVIKEYEFVGGGALWKIYIDRGRNSWEQVKREVNRVKAVKFKFVNNSYIKDEKIYIDCGTIGGKEYESCIYW